MSIPLSAVCNSRTMKPEAEAAAGTAARRNEKKCGSASVQGKTCFNDMQKVVQEVGMDLPARLT